MTGSVTANQTGSRSEFLPRALATGALAGLAGGLAFGAAMVKLGLLETIASLVRAESDVLGFMIHLMVAAVIGAGFGLFVLVQRPPASEALYWGLVYGAAWWFIGAVTMLPLLTGQPLAWDTTSARSLLPALVGHLVYGVVTATAFVALHWQDAALAVRPASLARGVVAGLAGAALLGSTLDNQLGTPAISASMVDSSGVANWAVTLGIGALVGLGYGLLHPAADRGLGPSLIRGLAYGFGWWVLAALTAVPLLAGDGLRWGVDDIRAGFATFPGYLLALGAFVALVHHVLTRLGIALLADNLAARAEEGIGTKSLRATGRGVVAGLVGGLVFTIVMTQIGLLSTVASLVGGESTALGLAVHLVIAATVGVLYALVFARRSTDVGSALGWGVAYGVLWWLLGPLTLLPVFLGDGPQWTVDAARDAYPVLIGHLAYGAMLGAAFYRLESRHDPWWVTRSEAEAARAERASRQLLSSAPGLWALSILIALTIPVLLGGT